MDEENTSNKRVTWYNVPCPVCGRERTSSWERRVCRALGYKSVVCESCVAKEYGITIEELRNVMEDHWGIKPCMGA